MVHEMITGDKQVLFEQWFSKRVQSPSILTANELSGEDIAAISGQLDVRELYRCAKAVMQSANLMLTGLEYTDLKRKLGEKMVEKLRQTGCVSEDKNVCWLLD